MIIAEKKKNINNTCLKIVFNDDIGDDFGNTLPYPSKHYIAAGLWSYTWILDGFFGTNKALEFLNDIKARFLITYPHEIDEIRHFNTKEESRVRLKHFQGLASKARAIIKTTARYDGKDDFIFWCLKLEAENLIEQTGQVRYDWLLDFALLNFGETSTKKCKDSSTLKSKCRSITNYYIERNFELDKYQRKTKTDKEWILTRTENMKRIKTEEAEKNRKALQNFLSGMFANDYKKKNGKWNVAKISKALNMSRPTVAKHLKALGEV